MIVKIMGKKKVIRIVALLMKTPMPMILPYAIGVLTCNFLFQFLKMTKSRIKTITKKRTFKQDFNVSFVNIMKLKHIFTVFQWLRKYLGMKQFLLIVK
jgi:hypothetical protein